MTKNDFLKLLRHSSKTAYDFAQNYVIDKLPIDFRYSLTLNASSDDPILTQFDIYPSDNDKIVELVKEQEVVELLCRKEKIPVWIDISVERIYKVKTIFMLLCAGRYSDNKKEFYYDENGTGAFGIKSPNLPLDFVEGKKIKLKKELKSHFWVG